MLVGCIPSGRYGSQSGLLLKVWTCNLTNLSPIPLTFLYTLFFFYLSYFFLRIVQNYLFKLVRDSSAVWLHYYFLLEPWDVRELYIQKTARFASPTLGRHISTFCGYQILFSIRNPYINRFTNHFSIHS